MRDIKGNVVNIQVSGPASAMKAKKLAEPRKIMLGGDLTGSVEFDGSQDVVLEAKVLNAQEKPDYSQNDETQPDYIKNRPGGYDVVTPGVTIQWDGVIGDRPKAQLDEGVYLVKVSDEVLTAEQMIGAKMTSVSNGEAATSAVTSGDVVDTGEYIFVSTRLSIGIVSTSVLQADGVTFPETGTYFVNASVDEQTFYISSLQSAERRALVPIPGELTNIKGGYDLPAISNQPVYSGTVPASTFSAATQAAKIAVAAVIEKNYGAPITLTNPLAEGATVNGTVNGTAVSGVVENYSEGLAASLYTTGASEQVAVVATGGSGGTLVCILTSDAVKVRGDPPETDMVLVLSQSREAMPKVIPAEYLDVDLNAVESRIDDVETAANNASSAANGATSAASAAQTEAQNATTAAQNAQKVAENAQKVADEAKNAVTQNPYNYLGVRTSRYKNDTGYMQFIPQLGYNSSQGKFYKSSWETDAIGLLALPNPFMVGTMATAPGVGPNNFYMLLHTNIYPTSGTYTVTGVAISQFNDANIYRVTSNAVGLEENTGIFLTLEPKDRVVLASSTAGSTKKFKITVDDAGTLSATEVTT